MCDSGWQKVGVDKEASEAIVYSAFGMGGHSFSKCPKNCNMLFALITVFPHLFPVDPNMGLCQVNDEKPFESGHVQHLRENMFFNIVLFTNDFKDDAVGVNGEDASKFGFNGFFEVVSVVDN